MSVADAHVAACLAAVRQRSTALADEIARLTLDQWQADTNCSPWRVHDLATHIVTSGRGFIGSIRRGLNGDVSPPSGGAHSVDGEPAELAQALVGVTDDFEALYDDLSPRQLDTICFHRRGNRSIRWYAAHRLAEVSFHGWDLETSLGLPARFDDDVARLLLPTLIESNVPRTYAAGLSPERGRGERFAFVVEGDPSTRWVVTINPDTLDVTNDERQPDLAITAAPADLALLVYGRRDLRTIPTVHGDPALVDRFARIFPRP